MMSIIHHADHAPVCPQYPADGIYLVYGDVFADLLDHERCAHCAEYAAAKPAWAPRTSFAHTIAIPQHCQHRIPTGERRGFSGSTYCSEDAVYIAIRRDDAGIAYGACVGHAASLGAQYPPAVWRIYEAGRAATAQTRQVALEVVESIARYDDHYNAAPASYLAAVLRCEIDRMDISSDFAAAA